MPTIIPKPADFRMLKKLVSSPTGIEYDYISKQYLNIWFGGAMWWGERTAETEIISIEDLDFYFGTTLSIELEF